MYEKEKTLFIIIEMCVAIKFKKFEFNKNSTKDVEDTYGENMKCYWLTKTRL